MPRITGSTGGHDTHDGAAVHRVASHHPNGQPEHGRSRGRREAASARGRQAAGRDSRPGGGSGGGRVPAGTPGLVICPKSVRDDAEDDVGADWSAADALRLRFPRPEMVASAAALFESATPWADGSDRRGVEPESARFRITVGPGVVRLSWANPVRAERSAEREADRHRLDVAVEEDRIKSGRDDGGRAGRSITEWSRKSRAAMCRTFAELDYSPLVKSGRVPAMVTLTYPGAWEAVAPDGASVKRHMVLWRKRFQREYGEPARYIWKLEFQRRGAPHIHLWMAPPMSPGRSGRSFTQWLSDAWAQVVDHPDPVQKARHRLAGTAIDIRNGLKSCDPKRLAIYFTKHSSPNLDGDKEYQHIVPELWRQPGRGPGRFWGVYGLKKAIAVAEVAQDAYLTARRIVRRWSRSQAVYGDLASRFPTAVVPHTAVRLVPRIDSDTGVVKHRRVRRRRMLCNQGGLAGGYALVNDGPVFASQLAAALTTSKPVMFKLTSIQTRSHSVRVDDTGRRWGRSAPS